VDDDEIGRALGINKAARLAASSSGTGLSDFFMGNSLLELPFFIYGGIMAVNLFLNIQFFGGKSKENLLINSGK